VPTIENLDFVRPGYIPGEPNAPRAKDASFLIEFDQWTEVECFAPPGFLAERKPAVVAGVRHVVVLQPAFARLIANWTVNRMMKEQKLHRVPDRFADALGVGADCHAFGNRRCACRHQLWSAFDLDQTHPAAGLDADVRMVAISWNLDAEVIRYLNDRLAFFSFVRLAVNRELGHKELD